jgi:hypothetical protein
MSLDDLDLEFEDEEDSKKKKKETVDFDVDLEFHTQGHVKSQPLPKAPSSLPPSEPKTVTRPEAEIRKIDEARAPQPLPNPVQSSSAVRPLVEGSSALKKLPTQENPSQEIGLQEQIIKIQIESQVKVSVAEFKLDFLSDILSDMKLMDHQVGQILSRIYARFPESKNEVLMIKKILSDFVAKRKK